MESLNELALKGHFENLKHRFEKKGMVKAQKGNENLLKSLRKAVSTIEDIYEKYPSSISEDNKLNYKSIIRSLHEHGSTYEGHPDIMNEKATFEKKPMQKASARQVAKKNKKAG